MPIDEYLRRCDGIVDEFDRMKTFSVSDEPMEVHRSHEYGSTIIHSIVTGTPSVVYGNMPNNGAISNLPDNAIAEVPTLVDRSGLRFTTVGALPTELLAYMQPHVAQHELFIQAAMHGRRDHVYQAAMFDPLTAATMTLDKIVEMCDELIAAHGDLLPKLDSPMRVPTSGKSFGSVDPRDLRASWDAAQKVATEDAIAEWSLAGPFAGAAADTIALEPPTPLEASLGADGQIDRSAEYAGADGRRIAWKDAAAKKGIVNLQSEIGSYEYVAAYGYAEIESIHAREAVLHCGSDDGVKIWLNGRVVHANDVQRALSPKEDQVAIRLNAGVNRLLVKVTNHDGGWGYSVSVSKPNF